MTNERFNFNINNLYVIVWINTFGVILCDKLRLQMSEKIYGVRMKSIKNDTVTDYWFYTESEREQFILYRASWEYQIVEFLGEQTCFDFDLRDVND